MSEKVNNVSVSAMDDIMKKTYINEEEVEWNGQHFVILRSLDMSGMLEFVDSVVRSCFDKDTKEYRPEAKDFAIRLNVIKRYANMNIPSNVDHQYTIAVCSGVVEMIMEHINRSQFNEMMRAIDAKMNNLASANIEMLYLKLENLLNMFDGLQNNVISVFDGITADDIKNIANAFANGNTPTEEGIVKAYIEQTHKDDA